MKPLDAQIEKAAGIIRQKANGKTPKIALTLGSGLGAVADLMQDAVVIPYAALPGFPQTGVAGHEGSLLLGAVDGAPVIFLKGRKHLYEGADAAVDATKIVIRTLKTLGVEILFLTNAAGSLRAEYPPGSLVAIADHINLTGVNPLAGPNDEEWGPRFLSMDNAWDAALRAALMAAGAKAGVSPLGEGVYCQLLGPTFETPAEIRMLKAIGADTVAMSTAAENIIARHCGLKCVGVSAITNLAAGMGNEPLSHEQTLAGAKLAEHNMAKLVRAFIAAVGP
jgi:xanthosine phosphorylase